MAPRSRPLPVLALVLLWPALASTAPVVWSDLAPGLGIGGSASDVGSGIGGGVAVLDADGDGALDIVATSPLGGIILLRQTSAGWIQDETALPIGAPAGEVGGVTVLDIERDGDEDLLVLRDGPDLLLRNDGGVFVDLSDTHLPGDGYWSVSAAVGDVDGDGDDDILVGNYIAGQSFPAHYGSPNRLLLNDGRGRFDDVTLAAGLRAGRPGCTLAVMFFDGDDDGDLDVYEVNDFGQFSAPNAFWRNDGLGPDGVPRFSDASAAVRFRDRVYGMGIAVADIDGDLDADVSVSSIGRAPLHRWTGTAYEDVTEALGAAVPWAHDGYQVTWHPLFLDLDGDGILDLFQTGGHIQSAPFITNDDVMPNVVLRGLPTGGFQADPAALEMPSHPQNDARGIGLGDLDNDGMPELVIGHANGLLSVLKRESAVPLPLALFPHPTETGPSAAGFNTVATCAGTTRRFFLAGGGGFASASQPALWITLPDCPAGSSVSLTSVFPSGYVLRSTGLMGSRVDLVEPDWITIAGAVLTLEPTDANGQAILSSALTLGVAGGAVGPISEPQPGRFQATVTLPENASGPLSVSIGGRLLAVHPVVGGSNAPRLFTQPRTPIAGQPVRILAAWTHTAPESVGLVVNGAPVALVPTSDPEVLVSTPVSATTTGLDVALELDSKTLATATLATAGTFDPVVSYVKMGNRLFIDEGNAKPLGVVLTLRDANGLSPDIANLTYRLLVDGVAADPISVKNNAVQVLCWFDVGPIPDGANLQVTIDGVPFGPSVPFRRITDPGQLAAEVSPSASHCGPSVAWAYADGQDQVTMLVFLRDAFGNPIPNLGPPPTLLPALGTTVFPTPDWSADDRHQIVVGAGTTPGLAALPVIYGDIPVGLTCDVELLPARPLPGGFDPDKSQLIVAPSVLPVSTPNTAFVTLRPRSKDGRLVGSGLPIGVGTTVGSVSPLVYGGLGHYDAIFSPGETAGLGALTATFENTALSTPVEIYDPSPPLPDPGPAAETEPFVEVAEPEEPPESDDPDVVLVPEPVADASGDAGPPADEPDEPDNPEPREQADLDDPDLGSSADEEPAEPSQDDLGAPDDEVAEATGDVQHAPETLESPGGCGTRGPARPTRIGAIVLLLLGVVLWRRRVDSA